MKGLQFPFEELELRPLEVAIGERLLRDPCLKLYTKTTRYWLATANDVTAGATRRCWRVIPARPHSTKGRRSSTTFSSSSSATVLFEACNSTAVSFFLFMMASTSKAFKRKEGQPSAPRGSGPAAAGARRKLSSWGSQMDLDDKLDKGLSLSCSSVGDESELLEDDDVISLTSSDPAG
ncbi:hypothetical protein M9458_053919, partial [Cirrhinus mrigala]